MNSRLPSGPSRSTGTRYAASGSPGMSAQLNVYGIDAGDIRWVAVAGDRHSDYPVALIAGSVPQGPSRHVHVSARTAALTGGATTPSHRGCNRS